MKVALVYDRVNKWGGAERVLLHLHTLFPKAPLYTSVYDKKNAQWADDFDVRTSFLQQMPYASLKHEAFALLMPSAFENFNFDEYELVISITSEAAKGIITKPGTKHLCYCLTPTRYLWSGYNEYFENSMLRTLATPAVSYLRTWDIVASKRPDMYVAISHEVQKRIKKYYGRDSVVVHPPLSFRQNVTSSRSGSYYLIVSRLVRYKRIDIAIEACNKLELPLQIIGVGDEEKNLKKIAGPTIQFIGKVSDRKLSEYYSGCKALLFPGLEDFGLSVVEAQAHGKPIIAFKDGGQLETVINGKTGILFAPQTTQAMIEAIQSFQRKRFDPRESFDQAKKFSDEIFEKKLTKVIKDIQNTV